MESYYPMTLVCIVSNQVSPHVRFKVSIIINTANIKIVRLPNVCSNYKNAYAFAIASFRNER